MRKLTSFFSVLILAAVLLIGCGQGATTNDKTNTTTPDPKDAVIKIINDNIKAMDAGDLEAYMSTVASSDSQVYNQTKQTMIQMFSQYKFKTTLSNIKVTELTSDTAVVTLHQETTVTNKSDNTTQNAKIDIKHTLVKENGKWKFKNSETIETTAK